MQTGQPVPTTEPPTSRAGEAIGWIRLTGLFGIAWFVAFAIGGIVLQGEPPAYNDAIAENREYFQDAGDRFLVGDYLVSLAFVLLFLPFVAGLRTVLRRAEGKPGIASQLVFAGGIITVVDGGAATAFVDAIALADNGAGMSDAVFSGFLYAEAAAIALLGVPTALFVASASIVIWNHKVLPRWLAAIGFAASVLLLAGAAFVLQDDSDGILWKARFVSFILFALFVLLTSVHLLLGRARTAASPISEALRTG